MLMKFKKIILWQAKELSISPNLKNIGSGSSKIGTSFGHNGCGQNGGTIVDDESTTSSTSHHGTFKNREFHVKVGDILIHSGFIKKIEKHAYFCRYQGGLLC